MKKQNRLFKLTCPLICSVGMLSTPLLAEDDDALGSISLEDLLNLEVVSATRSESKLSESPVPMSVITAKDIANSGLDNIPDILGRLPEIDVLHIGRSQTEVSLRGKGINFNRRLLVLIDGRTEYNDLFGVTLWHAFPISVDDIERIEVVRGPASALFGANAYSGVINIITKQANADNVGIVRAHSGQYGTSYASVAGNYKGSLNSFRLSFSQQSADSIETDVSFPGFNRIPSTVNFDSNHDESLDGMKRVNASAIFSTSENWNLRLNAGVSDGTLELFQQPGLPRDQWDVETQNIHATVNWFITDSTSFQANIYQNNFQYETGLVPSRTEQELLTAEDNGFFYPVRSFDGIFSGEADTLDYSFQFVGKAFDSKMAWVAGAERREIENKGGLVLNSERDITSYFGNFTLHAAESWIFGLGLRSDKDSITKTDIGYNASAQYALNKTDSVRMTARKAFRAPSLFELFSSVDLPVPNQNQQVNFRGNTGLEVETIESIDITYTAQFGSNMQATFELYHEEYGAIIGNPDSGLLTDVEFDDVTGLFISTTSFQNLADASSDGFQAGLLWLHSSDLSIYANYRFADPKDLNSVAGETFFTPEHMFKFGGLWEFADGLSLDFSFRYIGKTDEEEFESGNVAPDGPNFTRDNQESYNTLNLALHYRPSHMDNLKFYFVLDNALDNEYVEYYEYDQVLNGIGEMSGRNIWGGVSWNF